MNRSTPRLRERHGPRRARGLAAVEFVVTAPFLLLLLLAGAEIGRALVQYATLTYAVRASARYVSANAFQDTTQVIDLTNATISNAKNLTVYGNLQGTGPARLPLLQAGQVQVVDAGGDNIRVSVSYPYQPMLGPVLPSFGFGSGSRPLAFNMQVAVTVRAIS